MAVRSNHAAEHHGYRLASRTKPCFTAFWCVTQPREIRFLVTQPRFSEVVPNLPARCSVQTVHPLGCPFMQQTHHPRQTHRTCFTGWGMSHKVIMVRKHCPGFQLPSKSLCNCEQTTMQHPQPLCATKMMSFPVRPDGDKVSAALRELMRGRVCHRVVPMGFVQATSSGSIMFSDCLSLLDIDSVCESKRLAH